MIALPVDALIPEIVATLKTHNRLVLEAPPGTGKTTRVPPALMAALPGEIWVLEPRRLAARMSARRVAQELGEPVGQRVGYQVRFEDVSSAKTRVRFITEGLLARRMLSDPLLQGVGAIVLDEFHERHIHTDLALALTMRLQERRPELRLVVMSATLESSTIAAHLGAAVLKTEGKRFEVAIEHLPRPDDRPVQHLVAGAVRQLLTGTGDILVFLPGAAEIRRSQEALAGVGLHVVTLHGDQSPEEQDRAIASGDRRKVILSTNVAETSLTIEGVTAVVDSGLARVAAHSPWSGLPTLKVQRIAQAAAKQRAGRAGRVGPGRCIRLYTQNDFMTRPAYEQPELLRVDLSETLLLLHQLNAVQGMPWLEAPPSAAWEAAETLLGRLGAIADGQMTALGQRMARIAAHPRLSRLLLEAEARGVTDDGATVAAILSERDLRRRDAGPMRSETESEPLAWLEELRRAEGLSPGQLEARGIDVGAFFAIKKQKEQLKRLVKSGPLAQDRERAVSLAVLAGFPDRVARRRSGKRHELVFATGGSGELLDTSVVKHSEWMVALDAEERDRRVKVRAASAIELDWLLELFLDRIVDRTETTWNAQTERVDAMRRMRYEDFVIEEKVDSSPDAELVAETLFQAARGRGVRAFVEGEAFDRFVGRVAFLRKACPELELPSVDDAFFDAVLRDACMGTRTFNGLRENDILGLATAALGADKRRALDEYAPDKLQLPGGRKAPIDYPLDQPPHISSRLQDFFGMRDGPKLARGRVPLVIHLLAPNGRDVQVTTDLDGFWTRHYPAIAKELRRKYPRHSWPDDPRNAQPPPPPVRRR